MVQSDPVVIPLVGASTVDQLQENLGALEVELSADQMAQLNGAFA
jgi:aryl-alcohol dehydrogenase-like predicted oxidoreductase